MADIKTEESPNSPEIHFDPIVCLDPVATKTLEDDEEEVFKIRSKLYRYDTKGETAEWKERGVGDVKILRHKNSDGRSRILMRRDKTLKICANHFITSSMKLLPNCGSEKAWVWSTPADFADEEPKAETLAIRFANAENAQKFKDKFEECQNKMTEKEKQDTEKPEKSTESTERKLTDDIGTKLGEMSIKEGATPDDAGSDSETNSETKEDETTSSENPPVAKDNPSDQPAEEGKTDEASKD